MTERKASRNTPLFVGAALIVIGAIYLLQNLTGFSLGHWNWWALFILIPAFGSLSMAWRNYQANGKLTAAGRGPLVAGVVLTLVAAIFLFNLSWGLMWPFFLIIAGVAMFVTR